MTGTFRKGKTYEELYGKERAEEIKRKKELVNNKGKTFIKMYGKEKAKEMKLNLSKLYKGIKKGSLEEQFGKEKADKIKEKISKNIKGKNYEERYGKEKAKKIRQKIGRRTRKKTYEEMYGKEKAEKIKLKMSMGNTGKNCGKTDKKRKHKSYEERYGEEKAKKIKLKLRKKRVWTKEKIINNLTEIIRKVGAIKRSDISKLHHYYDICGEGPLRKRFGSLDNLAIEVGIEFRLPTRRGKIGNNEKEILDDIEKENNITLLRQYSIAGCFIDGYDRTNNIAYEIDEQHHKYQKIEDLIREDKIKEVLDCEFIRVKG